MKRIDSPNDYSVSDERNTLSTLFTFSNLKAYGGADLQEIFNRLTDTKRYIEKYGIEAVSQIIASDPDKRGSSEKSPIFYPNAPAGRKQAKKRGIRIHQK